MATAFKGYCLTRRRRRVFAGVKRAMPVFAAFGRFEVT
jgi:hypothetical protein